MSNPVKDAAYAAIEDGYEYDVNGVRCKTKGDVNKALAHGLDAVEEVSTAHVAEKPKRKRAETVDGGTGDDIP